MLVFISDLHLTDGTSGQTVKPGAFKLFRERLRDLAYDASWRADGRYRPIERLDIVLLGDILDVVRSQTWLAGRVRPWTADRNSPAFEARVGQITDDILRHNKASLDCLKSLQRRNVITVPRATRMGTPKKVRREPNAPDRVPVAVRLHYMVGNHDWFYHLPGGAHNAIRKRIVDAVGLSNDPDTPFAHDPDESPAIADICRQHRVLARHGDVFDPFNYEGERDASSLGDAIVVELLNRFPAAVAAETGSDLPRECLEGLKEIDNVRPLLVIPAWIDGLLRRTCPDRRQAKRVKAIWDGLADEFLRLDFVRQRDKWFQLHDLADRLEWALKFSKGVSLRSLARLLAWWSELTGGKDDSFEQNAFSERVFRNRTAKCIVYGHTHRHKIVPLDSSHTSKGLLDQVYLNSGTWRRVHEPARWKPKEQEFYGYHLMTYLAFFQDDERGGRVFESWTGALGD